MSDALDLGAEISRLAALPTHEYAVARGAEAKRLGMTTAWLDKAVAEQRNAGKSGGRNGRRGTPEEIDAAAYARSAIASAARALEETVANMGPEFSDARLADDFAASHSDALRFVAEWGKWLSWDGSRWSEDRVLEVWRLVKEAVVRASQNLERAADKRTLCSARTIAAVEKLARAVPPMPIVNEQLDADPWLLNTAGGLIDLRTGARMASDPSAYCTHLAPVAMPPGIESAEEEAPVWEEFLHQITLGDASLAGYLQRVAGYCATGSTQEQEMYFCYGTGGNGKGTFLRTISSVLGSYAMNAPVETFIEHPGGQQNHPTELARLRGARLVTTTETEEGRRWAEARIKEITGGDVITARFMRQDNFSFMPQFKLVVSGNNKPGFRSVDRAIQRRMRLIPFALDLAPEQTDTGLDRKLRDEFPQVLAWIVRGCQAYLRDGLKPPPVVAEATADYLADEDAIGRWLDEKCEINTQKVASSTELYQSWKAWAEAVGEIPKSQKRLSMELVKRGFKTRRVRSGVEIIGVVPVFSGGGPYGGWN